MSSSDLDAASSEIRAALSVAATDARRLLVVTGAGPTDKLQAFQAAAEEAGLKVETISLKDPSLNSNKLNYLLNKPSNTKDISFLVIENLDSANDEVKQEIEDALQGRSYLKAEELWNLPRLAGLGEHTPHWLPEQLRSEVGLPVLARRAEPVPATKI